MCGAAPAGHFAGMPEHGLLDGEGLPGVEAEQLLGRGDLVRAEGRAVGLAGVLLGRCRPADDGVEHDHRGAAGLAPGGGDGVQEGVHVLGVSALAAPVHDLGMPTVGGVTGGDVLAEGDAGVILDGNVVLVVEHDQAAQLLMPGQGAGLARDALHHVAVGGDDIDMMVERALSGRRLRVQQPSLPARGHRHSDGRSQALAERPGGDLDAAGVPVFRVPGSLRAPGAQCLQVPDLQPVPGQEQLDVESQASVPGREHEPVPAQPLVIRRIVDQHILEQQIRQRRQAHRRPGMPASCLLDRVRGEQPRSVHRTDVDLLPTGPLSDRPRQRRIPVTQAGARRAYSGPGRGVLLVHNSLISLESGSRLCAP